MAMMDSAESNTLLERGIEEESDKDKSSSGMHSDAAPALKSGALSPASVGAVEIPTSDTGPTASSRNTKEKTIPAKKSQNTKHKITNGDVTLTGMVNKSDATTVDSATEDIQNNNETAQSDGKKRVRKPRRIIPDDKEYIPENEQPSQSDVVGGRGGRSNHHPGNRPYWIRILESRLEYTRSRSDHEKARIANGILKYVHENLNGRFLNIDGKTKRWYVLPDSVVLDKIKQALRDKYVPYWARDLKIKNKKVGEEGSTQATTTAASGNYNHVQNMDNTTPQAALNYLPTFGSPFGGVQNQHLVDQAVELAAIKASRANAANVLGFTGAGAGAPATIRANSPASSNQSENKLGFLFGSAQRRQLAPTAAIPTVDDILKCKVDQMPSFGGVPNAGLMAAAMAGVSGPSLASFGMNPFQGSLPPTAMNSLGLGGLAGPNRLMNDAAHRGFGAGGNPGAPALPNTGYGMGANLAPSIGVFQGMNMKSLDQYLENKLAGPSIGASAFARPGANLSTLDMMNSLAGNNRANMPGTQSAFTPAAQGQSESKKTDWNAMYTRALTNSK